MLTKEEFAGRLKTALVQKRIKQIDLAGMTNVTAANMSNYIRGKAFPPVDTLALIAQKLNVSLDWLCGVEKSENKFKEPETYGDIAKTILFLLSEIMCSAEIGTSHIKKDRYPDLPDQYERSYKEEDVPSIAFTGGIIRTFIEDLTQMQVLLKKNVFNDNFYKRWLDDRISALDGELIDPLGLDVEDDYPF